MTIINCKCINSIFENYDYNNVLIKKSLLKLHNTIDNAWITIDKIVYSLPKNDKYLLTIFKNYYGLNVKEYILNNKIFSNIKNRIILLDKLKKRKIGILSD
jgi:hypothetical protein